MNLKDTLKLYEELEREAYWEGYILEQDNVDILIGMADGMRKKKEYPLNERNYYISLMNQRIDFLSARKGKIRV